MQVLITVVHLQRDAVSSNWFSVVLALQCLLLWAKVQYFSRCSSGADHLKHDALVAHASAMFASLHLMACQWGISPTIICGTLEVL